MNKLVGILLVLLTLLPAAQGQLSSKVGPIQKIGDKGLVKILFVNKYDQTVQSVRATLFLMDEAGKVAGFKTAWVIGGTKERKALSVGGSAEYNFVITAKKPFSRSRLVINRIILEDGTLVRLNTKSKLVPKHPLSDDHGTGKPDSTPKPPRR